jgi:hypothetical protein
MPDADCRHILLTEMRMLRILMLSLFYRSTMLAPWNVLDRCFQGASILVITEPSLVRSARRQGTYDLAIGT